MLVLFFCMGIQASVPPVIQEYHEQFFQQLRNAIERSAGAMPRNPPSPFTPNYRDQKELELQKGYKQYVQNYREPSTTRKYLYYFQTEDPKKRDRIIRGYEPVPPPVQPPITFRQWKEGYERWLWLQRQREK
jgi:hypothetical protein